MDNTANIKQLYRDNRGSGLMMVLIMVAFLSILAGVLVFVSYTGYQMRLLDKQGKNTFYTAEMVLDEINVGLQKEASAALTVAYQDVMTKYALYETATERNQKLYEIYYTKLQDALRTSPATLQYKLDLLRSYLSADALGDGDGSREGFGTCGAIVESSEAKMVLDSKGIVLKDLKISYVNIQGYVAMISTDIRIALPNINFAQSSSIPNLNRFCMIADEGIKVGNQTPAGSISVKGDIYAKSMTLGRQNGTDFNGASYQFVGGTNITFQAPQAQPGAGVGTEALVVSKEDVLLNQTTLVTSETDFWGQNIILEDSASVQLDGNTYVKNDVRLEGTGNKVVLSGSYTGFGTSVDDADGSSAIVVNGRDSSLDLSGLDSLDISGHTYVATKAQSVNNVNHGIVDAQTDVLMGESVAVKSNQLVYLVPPEALGCEIRKDEETNTVTIGESVYRSNPMRLEQYVEIKGNPDKYKLLDATRPIAALGGKKLSDYMEEQMIVGGGTDYRPIVVVKQTNADTLVYFYMQFKDEKAANQYFRDYYGVNKESVDRYTRVYADMIKMPANSTDLVYLHLAGNVLSYAGNSSGIVNATDAESNVTHAQEMSVIRNDTFQALTTKMVTNLDQLSAEEINRTVFHNIIDKDELSRVVTQTRDNPAEHTVMISTSDGSQSAILSTHNYTIDTTTDASVQMVICEKNVRVKKDFHGIIIAGGEIIVDDSSDSDRNVELTSLSLEDFTKLLLSKKEKDGNECYVREVFRDGMSYAYSSGGAVDYGTQKVNLANLIVYENWSKE